MMHKCANVESKIEYLQNREQSIHMAPDGTSTIFLRNICHPDKYNAKKCSLFRLTEVTL